MLKLFNIKQLPNTQDNMKTLRLLKLFDYQKAWMFIKSFNPRQRTYDKYVLDKDDFIGKSFECLMAIFPDAHVMTACESESDNMYAEVRREKGTLLIVFEKRFCVQAEYFPDKEEIPEK